MSEGARRAVGASDFAPQRSNGRVVTDPEAVYGNFSIVHAHPESGEYPLVGDAFA